MAPTIRDFLFVALLLIPGGLALASEETAIEVFQPIITEDQICLRRVTYVTHSSGVAYWGGFVDYTCAPNAMVTDSHVENRNAASLAGIKAWVDPHHFQEQELYGDTVRVYVDLRHLDASKVGYDVVSATLECVLANATASMSGWVRGQDDDMVDAKQLRVIVLGSVEHAKLSHTYRFKDLKGKVPRKFEFEE